MTEFMDPSASAAEVTTYSLSSIVEHHGRGHNEGHYTAFGKNRDLGQYLAVACPSGGLWSRVLLLPFALLVFCVFFLACLLRVSVCVCDSAARRCV